MKKKKEYFTDEPSDEILKSIESEIENSSDFKAEEAAEEVVNYPVNGNSYDHRDVITLDIDGTPCTRKMNDWIRLDPVSFHKALVSIDFQISRDCFRILMSTLRAYHIDYYRKAVGLEILIDMPGQAQPLAAKGLYNYEPVKFYKWWASDERKVFMTTREKIQLFLRVESIKKGTLLKKHVEYLNSMRAAR